MADEIRLSENIEAEFNPLVVIVAHDPGRYASFQALFQKNSFKCEVFQELPPELVESPPAGAIYFVSFNLRSHDAPQLARKLESRNNLCIVFAEHEGVENAAKLSSAKMTQTLQHPYTEKNFLMAVQTIVKKRRVQHEKDQRKQTVLDRRKGMADGNSQVDTDSANRIFKNEAQKTDDSSPLIFEDRIRGKKFSAIQEGRGYVAGHRLFMNDRARRGLRAIQSGLVGATFNLSQASREQAGFKVTVGTSAKAVGSVMTGSSANSIGGVAVSESRAVANGGVVVSQPNGPQLRAVEGAGATNVHSATEMKVKLDSRARSQSDDESSAKEKREGEVLVGYGKKDLRAVHDPLVRGAAGGEDDQAAKPAGPTGAFEETTKLGGGIVVPTWALIAAASIGILFCLWFIFQMLFHRH